MNPTKGAFHFLKLIMKKLHSVKCIVKQNICGTSIIDQNFFYIQICYCEGDYNRVIMREVNFLHVLSGEGDVLCAGLFR